MGRVKQCRNARLRAKYGTSSCGVCADSSMQRHKGGPRILRNCLGCPASGSPLDVESSLRVTALYHHLLRFDVSNASGYQAESVQISAGPWESPPSFRHSTVLIILNVLEQLHYQEHEGFDRLKQTMLHS